MNTDTTTARVMILPDCDICPDNTKATYDARLPEYGGVWGYVCQRHFDQYGPGKLGIGHGQRLLIK